MPEPLSKLVERWHDPEYWKDTGAYLDSLDCADELNAWLRAVAQELDAADDKESDPYRDVNSYDSYSHREIIRALLGIEKVTK